MITIFLKKWLHSKFVSVSYSSSFSYIYWWGFLGICERITFSYRRQLLKLCANNALSTTAKLLHHHHCWYQRQHAFHCLPKNCKDKFWLTDNLCQCRIERRKYFPLSFTKKSCKTGPKETETEIFLTRILSICSTRNETSKMMCGRRHFLIVEYC